MTNVMKPLLYVYFNCKSIREENSHNNRQLFFSLNIVFLLNPLEKFLEFEVTSLSLSLSSSLEKKKKTKIDDEKERGDTIIFIDLDEISSKKSSVSMEIPPLSSMCFAYEIESVCTHTARLCAFALARVWGSHEMQSNRLQRTRARVRGPATMLGASWAPLRGFFLKILLVTDRKQGGGGGFEP